MHLRMMFTVIVSRDQSCGSLVSFEWFTHSRKTSSSLECWCNRGFWETVFHRSFAFLQKLANRGSSNHLFWVIFLRKFGQRKTLEEKDSITPWRKVRFVRTPLQKRWGFLILWCFFYNTAHHDFTCCLFPFISLWGNWSLENWYSKTLLLWPLLLLFPSQTQKSPIFC